MCTLLSQLARQVLLSEEPAFAERESVVDDVDGGQQDGLQKSGQAIDLLLVKVAYHGNVTLLHHIQQLDWYILLNDD